MFPNSLTNLLPLALSFSPFTSLWGDSPLPIIQLDQATVYGTTNGSVTSYLDIPFAQPPVGDIRLRLPKPIEHYNGTIDATKVGPQCIQQMLPLREDMPAEMFRDVIEALTRNISPAEPRPESEDCLNINVLVPAGTAPDAKLPVVAFIYGGGFSFGSNTQCVRISKTCTALGALDQTRPRLFRRAPDISGPIGAQNFKTHVQNIGRSIALTALLLSPSSLWAFPLSLPSVSYSQHSVRAANGPGLTSNDTLIPAPLWFQGEIMVKRSVEIGRPIIFATMNYRVNAFGFLGGQEVKDAGIGNIGLHDQREGLRWINKHIAAFGGDPNRVTIWGPSAGAFAVGALVTNGGDTEGLIHAAVMSCGSLLPTGHTVNQQPAFDGVVRHAGCASAKDKLQCLRDVPAENLTAAAASVTGFFGDGVMPPWFPRADGVFIKEPVRDAVLDGRIADIPFVVGTSLDEGTLFATGAWNITTDHDFLDYMLHRFFPGASSEEVAPLLALYPNDPAQGSPFGTGAANRLAPMYKRIAAFEGDFLFQSTRRSLLNLRSEKQPTWTYGVERGSFEGMGYLHGNDVVSIAIDQDFTDYFIRFVATLNPNGGVGPEESKKTIPWPRYEPAGRRMLLVLDGEQPIAIGRDDARTEAMEAVAALSLKYPV